MSLRYTAMFIPSGPTIIEFTTKALQITGVTFGFPAVDITFNTKALNISTNSFAVAKGILNNDNGFMAF